jgi:cobalamin biosynthesis protein CobT
LFDSVSHLLNVKLKDGYDVQKLATKIYDIIYAKAKDESEKIDIKADEKEKDDTLKDIDSMLQELEDVRKMADDTRKRLQPVRDQKKGLRKQYKKEERASNKIQKAIEKAVTPLEEKLYDNDALNDAEHAVSMLEHQINMRRNELNKIENKVRKQEDGLAQARDNKANAGTSKELLKKANTKEKYHTNRKAKLEADKPSIQQKVQELQQRLNEAKDALNQELNKPGDDGKTPSQLQSEISQHEATPDPHTDTMNDLQNQTKPLNEQIQEANQAVADAREAALKKNMKAIMKAAQAANDAGLPSPIPPFTPNDDWSEADQVQKDFDTDASDRTELPVVNGMSPFGSNLRDVIMRLTDVSKNLKTLDITQVVTRKLNKSKVENLDSETDMTNIQDALEVDANGKMIRPHLPVTREYDRVQEKTAGGDVAEIAQMKVEKKMDIDKVTQVLRRKFRFKTKNRFRPNQEDGALDTREMWRIPHGLGNKIFEVTEKKIDSKVQVAIAVDVSGSMDKDSTENGRKVKELALILSESLTNAKVKHEILGYGASPSFEVEARGAGATFNRKRHALETIVYKKPEGRSGLQNLELEPWDNADGESLRLVGDRLLKAGAKKKIMFVISDGKPFLTDENTDVLDYDLHKAIQDCRKKKISVYGFGFNDSPKNFYGDKYCKVESVEKLVAFLHKNIETIS